MLLEGIIYKYEFKNNMSSNAEKLYNLIKNDSRRKNSLFLTALTNPKGALDKINKELIYVSVSMTNSVEYCIISHIKAAKKKGMTDNMLKELIAVVAMANETNRLVESYQVEVDEFMK